MIAAPRKGEPYPGRIPRVREQWARLAAGIRAAIVGVPVLIVAILFIVSVAAGAAAAVMAVGVGAATTTFVKNRTDRHNAAVDRGEIVAAADPHFEPASPDDLPAGVRAGLARFGVGGEGPGQNRIGRVTRFDGGWLIWRANPRDVAVVAGDDGGWAQFDPRTVPDLWAASEYLAGRGREP